MPNMFDLNTGFCLSRRNPAPIAYVAIREEEINRIELGRIYSIENLCVTLTNGETLFMAPSAKTDELEHLQQKCVLEHGAINIENLEKLLKVELGRMKDAWQELMEEL